MGQIVERRREAIKKDPSLKDAGDFLTILLTDPLFMNDTKRIIDECYTFFFAGSQTSAISSQNLIIALMKQPEYEEKIIEEIDSVIIQPHIKERMQNGVTASEAVKDLDPLDLITFENGTDMTMFVNCFNESLRMQPPVYFSSSIAMSETVPTGPL